MNTHELFEQLHEKGIRLQLDDNKDLKVRGKKENLTPDLLQQIKRHKSQLVSWLETGDGVGLKAIEAVDRDRDLQASFAQQRLWFIDQMEQGSTHFHIPGAMTIKGRFSESLAETALQQLIDRHETLRTVFTPGDAAPLQNIRSDLRFKLARHDLSDSDEAAKADEVADIISEDLAQPFNLAEDLMMRAICIRLADEECVLFFNVHHIAADGWSMSIIFKEFIALYEAAVSRRDPGLEGLPIQYADYAVWQREHLATSESYRRQLDYWQTQLKDLPQLHSLPTDYPRPPDQTFSGKVHRFQWSAAQKHRLDQFAAERGVTSFVVLYSAFSWLLNLYSDESDIVVGTPVANRLHAGLEPLVGFFVNTLVLRTDGTFNGSFNDYLSNVHQLYLDAQANQDVPFEHLVEALNPVRSTSHSPLFQILFNMQHVDDTDSHQMGIEFEPVDLKTLDTSSTVAQYDLSLNVTDSKDALAVEFEYNSDLFTQSRIARLADHFERLLNAAMDNPEQNLRQLVVLSGEEYSKQLTRLNNRSETSMQELCLHQWFEQQAQSTPEATALRFQGDTLSYLELSRKSDQLATHLMALGVGKAGLVGVCMYPSIDMITALLAVWKAGAAYVPIDPSYPKERIDFVLQDSGITALISQPQALKTELPEHIPMLELTSDWFRNAPEQRLEQPDVAGDDLAYVIYTSGSTGQPKGVMVEHRAVVNFVGSLLSELPSVANNRWLFVTSLSFDIALFEWFGALVRGGECLIAATEQQCDAFALKQLIEEETPGLIQTTPSRWSQLLDTGWLPGSELVALSGGEPLSTTVEEQLSSRVRSFWNCYGPTEATIWSLVNEVRLADDMEKRFSLGYSLANYQHLVLSPDLTLVPDGCLGELHIGGDSLARGYLNRPELTRERFIDNPFSKDADNPRLYKTGDLVRYHANGVIEYVGRVDDQVKIHGFRIELGEVEHQLLNLSEVTSAVVTAHGEDASDKQLIAYVVADQPLDCQQLRRGLARTLPDYMIPNRFVFLEAMPLTPNGKVDKKALPAPQVEVEAEAFAAPESEIEKQVAAIWASILKLPVDSISRTQHFFASGGHSLLSVRVIAAVRDALNVELSVRDIFHYPVLRDFVRVIEESPVGAARNPVQPLPESTTEYVASFAQQRLWIIDQMSGNSAHYNMPGGLRMQGVFDAVAAEDALKTLVGRHESLRTSFSERNGRTEQVIHEASGFSIQQMDVSALDSAEQEQAIIAEATSQVETPFDLTSGLLIRVTYIRQGDDAGVLFFNLHHIAADGWSMNILMDEFITLYQARVSNQPQPLPPLALQYKDFAAWQHDFLFGDTDIGAARRDQQLQYWREQLKRLPLVHELPLDFERPQQQDFSGQHHNFELGPKASARLKRMADEQGITLFMLLHAAFSILLARYSNQKDIVIGTVVSNRTQKELESLVGFFVNTLVLRTEYNGNLAFGDYLQQVAKVNIDAQSHQDLPFDYLVEMLNPERNASYSPLVQVVFNMNTQQQDRREIDGLVFTPLENFEATAQFDLSLDVTETGEGLWLDFEYATALFSEDTIARMARHFVNLLEAISEGENQRLKNLPLLDKSETLQLVNGLNNIGKPYPSDKAIHQLFEQHAQRSPEAIALDFSGEQLTYGELNGRANQLAHYLIQQGVPQDELIGLSMERSVNVMIAMLAILKVGGAYVPLDPSYPADRLEFMTQDSDITWLLCDTERSHLAAAQAIALDDDALVSALAQCPTDNVDRAVDPRHLAYIIYTSGSTGRPKGVMVEHRSVVRLVQNNEYVPFNSEDVVAQASNSSFDAATFEIWGALTNGGRLVLIEKNELLSPHALRRKLHEKDVTVLFVTTTLFSQVAHVAPDTFSRLKHCLFGGEAVDKASVDLILKHGKPERLLNAYGPTENTTFSAWYEITEVEDRYPIGRAINQTQCYVVDEFQSLVPAGAVGELCLGGDGLARGYLNREELSAERFVANPFSDDPESRLYRTGDLVRLTEDWQIDYLGRIDDQVKIRGFRIELGEIEQQLQNLSEVTSAIVIAREDVPGQKRLVAYVVIDYDQFDEEDEEDEAFEGELVKEMRLRLSAAMPDYMVPSFFVLLDRIPLTVNGKADASNLPVPDGVLSMGEYVAPSTDTERKLVDIWSDLLQFNSEDISVNANFFELGGHSLLAIKQVVQIKQAFRLDIDIKILFELASIAEVAKYIDGLLNQRQLSEELASLDEDSVEEMEF